MTEPAGGAEFEIAVVGSINLDISIPVPHIPAPGETVLGGDGLWSPGGKGANQAVAAARLGRLVAMIGLVGADSAGDSMLGALEADGVAFVGERLADVPTGLAAITVATGGPESGENAIAVSPGANSRLTAERIQSVAAVRDAQVVLTQFEIPLEAVVAAVACARGRVIVNPAPAPQGQPENLDRVVAGAAVVVPNKGELASLVGEPMAANLDEVIDQAKQLSAEAVVVTLGSDGALVVQGGQVAEVAAVAVKAVDTTAAGDAFCGGLADALVEGADLVEAANWAALVAAVAVSRRGAQASLGTRSEVAALAATRQQ